MPVRGVGGRLRCLNASRRAYEDKAICNIFSLSKLAKLAFGKIGKIFPEDMPCLAHGLQMIQHFGVPGV